MYRYLPVYMQHILIELFFFLGGGSDKISWVSNISPLNLPVGEWKILNIPEHCFSRCFKDMRSSNAYS